jgi:hypothetical protein
MDTIDPGVTGRRRAVSKKPRRPLWTSRVVCEYFGNVVPRSLNRWKNDPTLGFPQPITLNKRHYYIPDEIEAFALRLRAVADHEAAKKAASKPAVEAQPKPKKTKKKPARPRKERAAAAASTDDRAAAIPAEIEVTV